jgi:hypothetical protein
MFVLRGGEPTKPARSLGVGRGFGDNGSGLRAVDLGVSEVDHRKGTFWKLVGRWLRRWRLREGRVDVADGWDGVVARGKMIGRDGGW